MPVSQRHTLATSAAAVATALTLGIAIAPDAGAVDLPERSSAGSGSSAGRQFHRVRSRFHHRLRCAR
jgi:hypothetical protein